MTRDRKRSSYENDPTPQGPDRLPVRPCHMTLKKPCRLPLKVTSLRRQFGVLTSWVAPARHLLIDGIRGTSERGLRHGNQPHACRLGPGSQLLVPNGEERFGCADCEQAGKVDRVCASQGVSTG